MGLGNGPMALSHPNVVVSTSPFALEIRTRSWSSLNMRSCPKSRIPRSWKITRTGPYGTIFGSPAPWFHQMFAGRARTSGLETENSSAIQHGWHLLRCFFFGSHSKLHRKFGHFPASNVCFYRVNISCSPWKHLAPLAIPGMHSQVVKNCLFSEECGRLCYPLVN